jgi:hypothetical protein
MPDAPESLRFYVPSLEPGEEWWDVILHFHSSPPASVETSVNPPISSRFELTDNIWIEQLDATVAKQISEACGARNFDMAIIPQQGHTFAFVRKSRLPGYFSDTGGLEELAAVLAMSRLIRPTTMGIRNAARVAIVNGKVKRILAYQPRGALVDAFRSKQNDQDWLGVNDAQRLKLLMPWITTKELMPRRIHNAYWHHEYAVRTYYVDHRWSFVCTGLEALVHASENGSTHQSSNRVRRLAENEGISFSADELIAAYKTRSGLVHGSQFLSETVRLTDAEVNLYDRLEETLRKVLLRAFEDRTFAANFRDEKAIAAFLPLPPPSKIKKAGPASGPII